MSSISKDLNTSSLINNNRSSYPAYLCKTPKPITNDPEDPNAEMAYIHMAIHPKLHEISKNLFALANQDKPEFVKELRAAPDKALGAVMSAKLKNLAADKEAISLNQVEDMMDYASIQKTNKELIKTSQDMRENQELHGDTIFTRIPYRKHPQTTQLGKKRLRKKI